ncbi:MAG: methionyl-tRNA formyltransferase [Flavobacteriaceae bacterium]|nr:methionyl-tRNA formyltransferase [Flavobacteriaceae bacterium]
MKKDLRIVFMGTPEFAVTILDKLIQENHNIVGVITAPDKPAGRGRKLNESAVKRYATQKGLNLLQPKNLKDEDFIKELEGLEANLQVVVAFRMLPKVVWQMPQYGTFNLHASLLPQYRGAAPINWAIINGEAKTGVSTFFIDEKIDTGEMILQKETEILPNENAGQLHDKLMHLGSELVIETIRLIEKGEVNTKPQPIIKDIKTAYKLNKENCKINWNKNSKSIINLIRGLNPYPAAWTQLINNKNTLQVKIYDAEFIKEKHDYKIGDIITTKKTIKIAVNDGLINILEIKLPGKRKMEIQSLLNGYIFHSEAKML